MSGSNTHLVGQIALQEGFISPDQLDECLRLQSSSDGSRPIGLLLLDKGYLTGEQLEEVVRIQRLRFQALAADPSTGGLFGQLAVRHGFVTAAQLADCLKEQEVLKRGGSSLLLGQILVRKKCLTPEAFIDLLRLQNQKVVKCPVCDAFYEPGATAADTAFSCSKCGTVVHTRA